MFPTDNQDKSRPVHTLTFPLNAAGTRLLMVSIHGAVDPANAAALPADRLLLLAAVGLVSSAFCSVGEKKVSSSATDVSFGVRSGNSPSL